MSDYFFSTVSLTDINRQFVGDLESYSERNKQQIYVISAPLTDNKYSYSYSNGFIVLKPSAKIIFITFGNKEDDEFLNYVDDVLEDVASISDKYKYKSVIDRPRIWRNKLVQSFAFDEIVSVEDMFDNVKLTIYQQRRALDLLISLFIGSINDVTNISLDEPENVLEIVKHKIQLFDSDQTRFIYGDNPGSKRITIQGLSGTGKTELLLHKLKETYVHDEKSKICFTCHNKILADELRKRIPSFFNFMKVDLQIEWNKRLWCVNAWGQSGNIDSGAYRYISNFYNLPFYNLYAGSFKSICKQVLKLLKEKKEKDNEWKYAYTYMFVDESQDFDESFFQICEMVTEKQIFIAGDIFQSIFEDRESLTVKPDYLLSKCYRTDPKTLMFAHALGMGLFEDKKLWWLDEDEWKMCGYNVEVKNHYFTLSREPLRRFEDVDDYESLSINTAKDLGKGIVALINKLKQEYNTLIPNDIGIILIDDDSYIYDLALRISNEVKCQLNWDTNLAYETKQVQKGKLLISNRNNVKGLEFPFVVCYTRKILSLSSYRNVIYTMLTRSFLKSYLVLPSKDGSGLTDEILQGAKDIMREKRMTIMEPSEDEKKDIKARFVMGERKVSFHDLVLEILAENKVDKKLYRRIFKGLESFGTYNTDKEKLDALIKSIIMVLPDEDFREEN